MALESVRTAPVRLHGRINLPTDAYDATSGEAPRKPRLFRAKLETRGLIKSLHLCTLGDGKDEAAPVSLGRVRVGTAGDFGGAPILEAR